MWLQASTLGSWNVSPVEKGGLAILIMDSNTHICEIIASKKNKAG